MDNDSNNLGKIIKQRRVIVAELSLRKLAVATGVSASLIDRVETGERFPSARTLHRLAKPLGFTERELLSLANYLSPQSSSMVGRDAQFMKLDPYVAIVLSKEPVEVQRAILAILHVLKGIAKEIAFENGLQ